MPTKAGQDGESKHQVQKYAENRAHIRHVSLLLERIDDEDPPALVVSLVAVEDAAALDQDGPRLPQEGEGEVIEALPAAVVERAATVYLSWSNEHYISDRESPSYYT